MSVDVVVVGAGPTGLMLACELALAGVRPLVLERRDEPSADPKANGLLGQVVRVMDHRGLHERLTGSSEPPVPNSAYFMFGGLGLDLGLLPRSPVHTLPVTQQEIERVLEERAAEVGAEIRRGHELAGLAQDEDGVTLSVVTAEGRYDLRARWVVGADGAHSVTRKLAGIGFPGVHHDRMTVRSAHVTLPPDWVDPGTGALTVPGYGPVPPFLPHRTEHGGFSYAPLPGRPPLLSTTEWDQPEPDEPMTLAELAGSIRRVLGAEVPLRQPEGAGPHVLRRMTGGHTRVAARYADRRVLLIGDAAHVFGATGGGPGLNLGLQDAVNLGWKLAATVRGDAPVELLGSFGTERRAAAERMIVNARAQAALIAPGSDVTGLRELFAELLTDPAAVSRLAHLTAGADVRYDMGPWPAHPRAGTFVPELTVETTTGVVRLADLTHAARPLLLDLTPGGVFAQALAGRHDRLDVVRAAPVASPAGDAGDEPLSALLLRPDCYLAWACSTSEPGRAEVDSLREAAARWLGGALTRST
ncbi:FAD-dependent oxidoreductase [Actinoplanes cyaneus]|uniref:FAD-dependent oxidoreductase n=1 Tax=Actinoplanes cyaneus TaxID=52696 RepID=A0A919IW54_9ACTN|nr:FAD-dependent monooxygenase [Actinoplanes cyaneus]MCW2140922.1 2-polyprenyl-6-methoxyphenol hydroxylase [Actinoplanes cyaneus]GID69175.1 FAD-dependent oxidoreductase [Actinoplanes cyaneus]